MLGNKKHFLILLILIIFSLALVWWVIKPAVASIQESAGEISYQKERLAQLLKEGQSVIENKKNLAMIEAGIDEINNVWLKLGNELRFITDLEGAAVENNLKQVINFDNSDYNKEVSIKIIPLSLHIEGELEDIMAYINGLEAFDYYININKIEIDSRSNQTIRKSPRQIEEEAAEEEAEEIINLTLRLSGLTYWK